jgi:RNA polymerase sigma factor (sigma-70 family)
VTAGPAHGNDREPGPATGPGPDAARTVGAVWKLESARIVAGPARMVHDIGIAEEAAQDALVAALEQWPRTGVPGNPGAWLTAVAKRRAVDRLRASERLARAGERLAHEERERLRLGVPDGGADEATDDGADDGTDLPVTPDPARTRAAPPAGDTAAATDSTDTAHAARATEDDARDPHGVLRLMFVSCHPVLPPDARAALTLRLLGGLTAAEIARAFLVTETVIVRRIAAARRTIAERRVPFELPAGDELTARLSSVLEVIYLIFNEGYSATSGDDLLRPGLTLEALRLGGLLASLVPDRAEVHGLVALMELHESRSGARTGPSGEPVRLHEQNRGRWDRLRIERGFAALLRARALGEPPGPYVLQAAIAVVHARARTPGETDWAAVAALYESLVRQLPTPVVRLNRAVAVGRARGPGAGLALVDELAADPRLKDYHLLPGVRGDLLAELGRPAEAGREFERAAALTANAAERAFLLRRAAEAGQRTAAAPGGPAGPALGATAAAFLGRPGTDPATARSYGQTLRRLRLALGDNAPLGDLTAGRLAGVFTTVWGTAAPATWNRHRAALRSFAAFAGLDEAVTAGVERRPVPSRRTPPLPADGLAALWSLPGTALRERVLWRLLYESGAPAGAVLALDADGLDLEERRTRPGAGRVRWGAGTAALLPELLAGRTRGPLFLTERRPGPGRRPPEGDLCPDTGRARLSYERAEYLFTTAAGRLGRAGEGWTLGRLRRSDPDRLP